MTSHSGNIPEDSEFFLPCFRNSLNRGSRLKVQLIAPSTPTVVTSGSLELLVFSSEYCPRIDHALFFQLSKILLFIFHTDHAHLP